MKYILLISFVALISCSRADQKDEKHRYQKECQNETGLDEDTFKYIRETGNLDKSDRTQEQFTKCVGLKMDFLEEDGSLKKDNIVKYFEKAGLSRDTINKSIEKCQNIQNDKDNSGFIIEYVKCFSDYLPKDLSPVVE